MIDFVYDNKILDKIEDGTLEIVDVDEDEFFYIKGLTFESGDIWINLSANQWKEMTEIGVTYYMTETITHETIHTLLFDLNDNIAGQEHICRVMAGQEDLV